MIEGISSNPSENQEVNKHSRWHNNMGCKVTHIGTYHHDEKFTERLKYDFSNILLLLPKVSWMAENKRV